MSQSTKNSEKIKEIESNSWKGTENFDVNLNSISEVYEKKWKNYLLQRSIEDFDLKGKKVINVGGGHGEEAEFLIKNGIEKVLLIDIAPGQIESAKIRKKEHNLHNLLAEVGDAEDLHYDGKKFNLGFIYMALHHFPSHEKSITEICRVSEQIIFIDIMNSGLTKFLGLFGLFKEEWCGIKPNRLDERIVNQIMKENNMEMEIEYFFYPPYYGNSLFLLRTLELFSRFINQLIRFDVMATIFGNVAIIKGKAV